MIITGMKKKQYCLIGERTGTIYRIGDIVDVMVMRSNPENGQIDFILADDDDPFYSGFSGDNSGMKDFPEPSVKKRHDHREKPKRGRSRLKNIFCFMFTEKAKNSKAY
jgi:hypothetical protein